MKIKILVKSGYNRIMSAASLFNSEVELIDTPRLDSYKHRMSLIPSPIYIGFFPYSFSSLMNSYFF